ncbi:hypothetical protein BSS2_I0919 [Brucella suis bv. 1 str. S2]|uniref:Uncharacterized protein n=4 Tax=Brucella TaxID=234 RepID=Q2YNS6_BRUA2|nr:hypothetical protein BR0941 [Brucella suis 1330]AAX74313.1 hypothetical protein BruAb1_0950 [Brucella abortus bv. 1 str. 9-941]ACO00731.1 Hypothetical protein, conserved [Brucella melitensis ATCC 23457]AEU05952.1 hypothetical protein BSVBI22_A0937 [Brucella suis VBI22]AHN46576.1 hypothetical protein BSS2_I0919 [Brucella suis bv. 1 str. S2]EFG37883.1 conserved hypothetical protein [Brucella sp. NVSL 07-0026]EXU82697.1 hypothetical protein AX23_11180 [Brucella melitensis 548]CAJ10915.1 cons
MRGSVTAGLIFSLDLATMGSCMMRVKLKGV